MRNTHEMVQVGLAEGGEEWRCTTCERHMLVNWRPEFRRVLVHRGDDSAWHSGSSVQSTLASRVDDAVTANEHSWLHKSGICWDVQPA
jgi:hypothetical protein